MHVLMMEKVKYRDLSILLFKPTVFDKLFGLFYNPLFNHYVSLRLHAIWTLFDLSIKHTSTNVIMNKLD